MRDSGKLVKHYKWFHLDRRIKHMVIMTTNGYKKPIVSIKCHEEAEG